MLMAGWLFPSGAIPEPLQVAVRENALTPEEYLILTALGWPPWSDGQMERKRPGEMNFF
jgi:hypothetical protein